MFLCIVSAHFFLDFAVRLSDGEAPRYRSFYAAAVALGLAGLAKYDAIFMAVGLFGLVLLRPRLRALLRTPHPYLAMAICVAIQTPVFYWNFSNGFASYRYNLNSRLDTTGLFSLPTWSGSADFLATGIAVFSPFLIVAAVRAFRAPMRDPFSDALRQLALLVFAASTLAMLALCQVTYVLFYWNIVGYLLLYPAIVGFAGRRTLIGHSVFGLMMAALITFNGSVAPLASLVGRSDWESSVIYGWDDVAAAAKEALKEHPDALIGATRYTLASQLGFALGSADVVSFSTRVDQFKLWFDPQAHSGRNAIVMADASNPIDYVKTQFGSVTVIRTLPV